MDALVLGVLVLGLAAEFVNGWTDAPNSIATVVSTRVLTPSQALGMASVLNALGAGVWAIAIAALGWSVGEAAKHALGHVQRYERALAGAIVAIGIALWLWHRWRSRRAERQEAAARSR